MVLNLTRIWFDDDSKLSINHGDMWILGSFNFYKDKHPFESKTIASCCREYFLGLRIIIWKYVSTIKEQSRCSLFSNGKKGILYHWEHFRKYESQYIKFNIKKMNVDVISLLFQTIEQMNVNRHRRLLNGHDSENSVW